MQLDFIGYELVGLKCPNFIGVKKNGQKLVLEFADIEMCEYFNTFGEGSNAIHIHQNGTIYATEMEYDFRNEEWVEKIKKDLTKNEMVKNELDKTLKEKPLYMSKKFPYEVSTERDLYGCTMVANSLESLLKFLKNY